MVKRRPGEESYEGEVRSRGEKGELGEEEEARRGGAGARCFKKRCRQNTTYSSVRRDDAVGQGRRRRRDD